MKRLTAGFTLVEMIVVISVISILASVIYANFNDGRAISRDAKRQADLKLIQNAVELYKNKYGRYPAGCNGGWSGQLDSNHECADGRGDYIRGEAGKEFVPEFMKTLPSDPKPIGPDSGYQYLVNNDGSSYKITAYKTVEELRVFAGQPVKLVKDLSEFRFCGEVNVPSGLCNTVDINVFGYTNTPTWCVNNHAVSKTSYAILGGYANGTTDAKVESNTEAVWCTRP